MSNTRFLGKGNHLGLFSGASDQPEGQELGGGAVGGQEGLQEVKFFPWGVTQLLSMLETWFWPQNQCFGIWGIICDHFQKPQIDLKAKNRVEGL